MNRLVSLLGMTSASAIKTNPFSKDCGLMKGTNRGRREEWRRQGEDDVSKSIYSHDQVSCRVPEASISEKEVDFERGGVALVLEGSSSRHGVGGSRGERA